MSGKRTQLRAPLNNSKSRIEVTDMTIPSRTIGQGLELTPADLGGIQTAASKIEVQGARYPEALEARTGL